MNKMSEESHINKLGKEEKKRPLKSRIEVLIFLPMLISLISASSLLYDLLGVKSAENAKKSTQSYTTILLVVQLIGFYGAALGNIYSTLTGNSTLTLLSIASVVSSFTTLILRFSLELLLIEYRRPRS